MFASNQASFRSEHFEELFANDELISYNGVLSRALHNCEAFSVAFQGFSPWIPNIFRSPLRAWVSILLMEHFETNLIKNSTNYIDLT